MYKTKKDHAVSMAEARESQHPYCVKAAKNKLIIELRVYDQNPIEFFLQFRYQVLHLLNNQDDANIVKCPGVVKFLNQTVPVSLEELTAIYEEGKQAG